MQALLDLAARTGRHVGTHISLLLASLEAAGLLPSETEAQEELGAGLREPASSGEDVFGFDDAHHMVGRQAGEAGSPACDALRGICAHVS
jgi:hypothetical protein